MGAGGGVMTGTGGTGNATPAEGLQAGRPSGIAFVTCSQQRDGPQAIREKDGKHLGSRYLELSLPH